MKFFSWFITAALICTYSTTAEAADIYTVSCPKCDYKVRLRSGGTKMNHTDPPSVYFCSGEKKLVSIKSSLIKNGKTDSSICSSKLVPFNPRKENQKCPVCGGKIVVSDHAIAC